MGDSTYQFASHQPQKTYVPESDRLLFCRQILKIKVKISFVQFKYWHPEKKSRAFFFTTPITFYAFSGTAPGKSGPLGQSKIQLRAIPFRCQLRGTKGLMGTRPIRGPVQNSLFEPLGLNFPKLLGRLRCFGNCRRDFCGT